MKSCTTLHYIALGFARIPPSAETESEIKGQAGMSETVLKEPQSLFETLRASNLLAILFKLLRLGLAKSKFGHCRNPPGRNLFFHFRPGGLNEDQGLFEVCFGFRVTDGRA